MRKIASILAISLMAVLTITPLASTATISCKTPVLAQSAGQSNGLDTSMAYMQLAGMYFDAVDAPQESHIKLGVGLPGYAPKAGDSLTLNINRDNDTPASAKSAKGTKYQTVIFVMGCSTKGMGASGLNIDTEIKRVEANIKWCQTNSVKMIGWQLEGVSQRSKAGSDNERIYDAVAPKMDQLIIASTADQDKKFTNIAAKEKIAIEIVSSTKNYAPLLKTIFGIK